MAAVVLAPLPLGGILPLARTVLEVAALLAFVLTIVGGYSAEPLERVWRPAVALAAVGLWGFVQALPFPRFALGLVSPRANELWRAAAELDPAETLFAHLSLAPAMTLQVAVGWLAMAAALVAAALTGAERRNRRLASLAWLAVAIFAVLYGIDSWARLGGALWGMRVPGDASRLRGTMINPNHFAFYLNLALAGAFAWGWWGVRRARERLALERRVLLVALPVLTWVLLFGALMLTGSRGGTVAALAVVCAQAMLLVVHYRSWEAAGLGAAVLVLGFGAVVTFGLTRGFDRWWSSGVVEEVLGSRVVVYLESLGLWWQFPLTGTGLGTFRQAFPMVQPAEPHGTWTHAHNDLLELLVTGGVVAPLLVAWGGWHLMRRLERVWRRGRRSEDRAVGLAALGAVAGALVHSALDFSLTVPANALTLAILCGMAAAAATYERKKGRLPGPEAGE